MSCSSRSALACPQVSCGNGVAQCPSGFTAQCATGTAQPACVNGVGQCCTSPSQCQPVLCVTQTPQASCCADFDCGFTTCAAAGAETVCNDGQDNDGDGLTDYPADPGCTSISDTSENDGTSQCQDGIDNDGDGQIDMADGGCASRLDNDESTATPQSGGNNSSSMPSEGTLLLSLSDSRLTILPNEIYTYGVTITNTGQSQRTGVNVRLTLPARASFRSANQGGQTGTSFSSSSAAAYGQTIIWSNVTVPANGSLILTAEVQAQNAIANGEILSAQASFMDGSFSANDQTTVLVMTANDGCIDVIKETYDTAGNILTPVTQFSFTVNANLSGSNSSGGSTTIQNDGGGRARFVPMAPGTYTVTEVVPSTWTQLSVTPANGVVTVTAGSQCAVVTFKNRQTVASSSSSLSVSSAFSSVVGVPECSDGLDNDSDGVVDYPADPGCTSLSDSSEGDGTTQCQNGVDDDGDGKTDMSDSGCKSAQDNSEVDTAAGTNQYCTVSGLFCDTQPSAANNNAPTFTCQNYLNTSMPVGYVAPAPTCRQCNCSSSSSRISVASSTTSSSRSSSTTSSSRSSSSTTSSSSSTTSSSSSSSSSTTTSSRSSSSSSLPYCGDGFRDSGEQCGEPGLSCPSGQSCNLNSCRCSGSPFCGDGRIDSGEQCNEPGLTCSSGDTCDTRVCLCNRPLNYCGDGRTDAGEQCGEPGLNCPNGQICNTATCSCRPQPVCGNGQQDAGEQCGEPGLSCQGGQTCNPSTCLCAGTTPFCGNGQQDAGEQCGEPGLNCPAGQTCNGCRCSGGVACGNGRVEPGEQCNEPGLSCPAGQTCGVNTCLCSGGIACGNGRAERGEQCNEPGLSCSGGATCNVNTCLCVPPPAAVYICGNNQIEPGEECDDGNAKDLDGCSMRCLRERGVCGDGVVQTLLGEQCEPATFDRSLPYQCGQNCRFVSQFCGDGKRDAGEQCDLGADNSNAPGATCRTDCSSSRCGDSIVDPTERCDDGNRVNGDGCSYLCLVEPAAPSLPGQVIPFEPGSSVSSTIYSSFSSVFSFPTSSARSVPPGKTVEPPELAQNGPPIVAVIAAGAAAGVAWVRRKRLPPKA